MFKGSNRIARGCLAVAIGITTPVAVWAQSVPPAGTEDSSAGGPMGSQTQPGVRPPRSQRRAAVAVPGGQPGTPGLPQSIRWTEDWSRPVAKDAPIADRIKHIPIGAQNIYLTLGGEARAYYTAWDHQTGGRTANDANDPVQRRLRLLADLHVGSNLRAFVELGDNHEYGASLVTPPNRGPLDIQQAFVDVTVPLGDAGKVTVRPGRFEMPLGNGKLVTLRDGVNQHLIYQGLRATYILPGKLTVDTFAVRPMSIKDGEFNDGPNHTQSFHGVYVSAPHALAGFGVDAYWYELKRDSVLNAQGRAEEDRNSWGARLWQRTATWDLDVEGTYQSGHFGSQDISAWAVMLDGGYSFPKVSLQPRLGLRANVFSGDGDRSNGTLGTFVAPAPRFQMLNAGVLFNYSNLMNLNPTLTLKPAASVTVITGAQLYWRHRLADATYTGPSGASFAATSSGRFIGTAMEIDIKWQATRRLQFGVSNSYFMPSSSLESVGGKYGNYFGAYSSIRF